MILEKSLPIESFFKNPNPKIRAILVYGANEGFVDDVVKKSIKIVSEDIYDPFNVVYINAADVMADESVLLAEYGAQSLLGTRRAIIIKNADNNLAKVIKSAFLQVNSDTLLVIQAGELSKKSSPLVALANEFDDFVAIACYEDREDSLAEVIKNKIASEGFTIDFDALDLMVSRLGADRKSNVAEIEKLMVYMGDKRNITLSHVQQAVSDIADASADDVSYFLASGRLEKALNKYNAMVNEGTSPATVLRILYGHFSKLLQVQAFREQGLSEEEAIKKLYPPVVFFRKKVFQEQIKTWSKEKLLKVIELLQETEKDCKTTGYPDVLLASYCVMKIAMAYKK